MATASSSAAGNQHTSSVGEHAVAPKSSEQSPIESGDPEPASIELLFVGKQPTTRVLLNSLPKSALLIQPPSAVTRTTYGKNVKVCLTVVSNQKDALTQVRERAPRAILVEVEDNPRSRVQFCHSLRTREPTMEIIAVGKVHPDSDFEYDGEVALPLTAENVAELASRYESETTTGILVQGPFRLNMITRVLSTPHGVYRLTPKLATLLGVLLTHPDEIIHRSELMETVWETDFLGDTRTLDVHVRWLRQRLEADPSAPQYLITIRGKGYQLVTS